MNRLVLIGNGFDLAHGLKTSYKNFKTLRQSGTGSCLMKMMKTLMMKKTKMMKEWMVKTIYQHLKNHKLIK